MLVSKNFFKKNFFSRSRVRKNFHPTSHFVKSKGGVYYGSQKESQETGEKESGQEESGQEKTGEKRKTQIVF
jgi:hypothetical protein